MALPRHLSAVRFGVLGSRDHEGRLAERSRLLSPYWPGTLWEGSHDDRRELDDRNVVCERKHEEHASNDPPRANGKESRVKGNTNAPLSIRKVHRAGLFSPDSIDIPPQIESDAGVE